MEEHKVLYFVFSIVWLSLLNYGLYRLLIVCRKGLALVEQRNRIVAEMSNFLLHVIWVGAIILIYALMVQASDDLFVSPSNAERSGFVSALHFLILLVWGGQLLIYKFSGKPRDIT